MTKVMFSLGGRRTPLRQILWRSSLYIFVVVWQGRGGSNPGRVPGGGPGDPLARTELLSPPSSTASCLEHCRALAHQDRSLRVKVILLIFIFFYFLYRMSQNTKVSRAELLSPPSTTAGCLEYCRALAHQDRSVRVKVILFIFIMSHKTIVAEPYDDYGSLLFIKRFEDIFIEKKVMVAEECQNR